MHSIAVAMWYYIGDPSNLMKLRILKKILPCVIFVDRWLNDFFMSTLSSVGNRCSAHVTLYKVGLLGVWWDVLNGSTSCLPKQIISFFCNWRKSVLSLVGNNWASGMSLRCFNGIASNSVSTRCWTILIDYCIILITNPKNCMKKSNPWNFYEHLLLIEFMTAFNSIKRSYVPQRIPIPC